MYQIKHQKQRQQKCKSEQQISKAKRVQSFQICKIKHEKRKGERNKRVKFKRGNFSFLNSQRVQGLNERETERG